MKRLACIMILAALLGCPFDALWQRERKLRLLRAVSREGESAAC